MLEFSDVSLRLFEREILKDITFRVPKGSITALIGKNGSGKSSLLRCICREVDYLGRITIGGKDNKCLTPRERARYAALLPQQLPMTDLSVSALTLLGRTPHMGLLSRYSEEDRRIATEAMALCGVLPLAERSILTLSGGERQRAHLSMLLAQDTPLLLLDEPTAALDSDARNTLLHLLATMAREKGKTILIVLHDLNDAVRFADHLALLDSGRLAFCGTREEFLATDLGTTHFGLGRHEIDGETPFFY